MFLGEYLKELLEKPSYLEYPGKISAEVAEGTQGKNLQKLL